MESDVLSAVFSQLENASIAEPFSLKTGISLNDLSSFYKGEEVMKNVCPRLVWFSLPADSDYEVMSQFAKKIVEHQLSHSNFHHCASVELIFLEQ